MKSVIPIQVTPALTIPTITEGIIQRTIGIILSSDSKLYFQFRIPESMTDTDLVQIVLPINTVYSSNYDSAVNVRAYRINSLTDKTRGTELITEQVFTKDGKDKYYLKTIQLKQYCSSGCAANTLLFFELNAFNNPQFILPTANSLDWHLQIVSSQNYITARMSLNAKYIVEKLQAMSLGSVSLLRASKDPNVDSRLTVSVATVGFKVQKDSNINLQIPVNQMAWEGVAGITCRKSSDNSELSPCFISKANDVLNVTFTEFCSAGNSECALDTTLGFYIDGFKNPSYQPSKRSNNAVLVRVIDGYLYIYGESPESYPTPSIETPVFLTDMAITRDNNVAGDTAMITTVFKIPTDLPTTTKLYLQLPPFSFYADKLQACYNV